jgi:hypothetical protein
MKKKVEVRISFIVVASFSLLCGACRAQSICPWLNAATASGVLGGAATVEVSNTGASTGTCVFRLPSGTSSDTLRIAVVRADHAENAGKEMKPYQIGCTSSSAPLKAVGNEAVLCVSNTGISSGELVVGRVRDKIFTVSISTSIGNDSETSRDILVEKAEEIAKQVAGALF